MAGNKFHWRWLTWPPVVTFSLVFLIFLIVSLLRLDPDFGWHLKSGQYFLLHGIPATDIFTYTASNFPWVNHEWLSDIFLSTIYSGGGYVLLCFVYSTLWTVATWLVGRKAHNLVVILAVIAMAPYAGVRAIMWSVLCLAVLSVIVSAKNHRYWLLIPPLFLLWANIHGSFVIGFVYLAYISIKQRSWRLATLIIIGAIFTLINPYGIELYTEVTRTLFDSSLRWRISEWQAVSIPWVTTPYVILWASGFILTGFKKWKKYLGIDVLFFLAGVASTRNLVLFVIISLALTGDRLRLVAATIPKNLDKPRRRFVTIAGFVIVLSVLAAVINYYWDTSIDREYRYPRNAVTYLQEHTCSGALFNDYDYGGYLIWKLPSHKVYIDGRMPSWVHNGRKYMDDYLAIEKDDIAREKHFMIYDIRCAIIKNNDDKKSLSSYLKKKHWRVVTKDPNTLLLLRL